MLDSCDGEIDIYSLSLRLRLEDQDSDGEGENSCNLLISTKPRFKIMMYFEVSTLSFILTETTRCDDLIASIFVVIYPM